MKAKVNNVDTGLRCKEWLIATTHVEVVMASNNFTVLRQDWIPLSISGENANQVTHASHCLRRHLKR
jgi:hypothetical protein